jgi:hypothetical protein
MYCCMHARCAVHACNPHLAWFSIVGLNEEQLQSPPFRQGTHFELQAGVAAPCRRQPGTLVLPVCMQQQPNQVSQGRACVPMCASSLHGASMRRPSILERDQRLFQAPDLW